MNKTPEKKKAFTGIIQVWLEKGGTASELAQLDRVIAMHHQDVIALRTMIAKMVNQNRTNELPASLVKQLQEANLLPASGAVAAS